MKPTASPPPPSQLQPHELRTEVLAKSEATPTMDFKSLEARLKETNAIDAFTKLKLKTEVDVLLGQFRAYYQGHLRASLTDLRRSYDQLMFKVLALLQNTDATGYSDRVVARDSLGSSFQSHKIRGDVVLFSHCSKCVIRPQL